MDQKLINKIAKRKEEGTLRSLSSFNDKVDFFSNDYLGLSRVEIPMDENRFGATGSRLISGTSNEALQAEASLANFFNAEAGLIFNSGYDANLGFFSAVPQRGDLILYDELIHASVRDGMRLSFATSNSFRHNDLFDLEAQLKKASSTVYVAVESLYSMDGDIAPLKEIVQLCKSYGAYLIVDEAHSAGVFGNEGRGLADELVITDNIFARLVTFGKAFGSHGAIILGSTELKEYLYNFSRSFIYTTALPPSAYARMEFITEYRDIPVRVIQLQENIAFFRSNLKDVKLISDKHSPIQIIEGDLDKIKKMSENLMRQNIAVKAIYSPTVPIGKERLRICLHSFNTKEEIRKLIGVFEGLQN